MAHLESVIRRPFAFVAILLVGSYVGDTLRHVAAAWGAF